MIDQISITIVGFFIMIIVISLVVLIAATPKALEEYRDNQHSKKMESNKVGQSLSGYMEELSRCNDDNRIGYLVQLIEEEAKYIIHNDIIGEQSKNARSVLSWLDKFSIERHINDLKKFKQSSQIRYNAKNKDFKLMVPH